MIGLRRQEAMMTDGLSRRRSRLQASAGGMLSPAVR